MSIKKKIVTKKPSDVKGDSCLFKEVTFVELSSLLWKMEISLTFDSSLLI